MIKEYDFALNFKFHNLEIDPEIYLGLALISN